MKLPIFVIPLVAVSCLLAVLGPQFSTDWTSFFDNYASAWRSVSSPTETEDFRSNTTAAVNDSVSNHSVSSPFSSSPPPPPPPSSSSSSSPPPPIDEKQSLPQLPNMTTVNAVLEETAINEGRNVSSEGNYEPAVVKARKQREFTKLEKIEAGLRRARAAIKEAKFLNQTHDPDLVPNGPMYWNAKAFHRSYLEMEKELKIFVYEEGEPPLFHNGPCKSIYSTEGNFIHAIEMDTRFRTKDSDKAHVFFLPLSVAMLVQFVYVRDSHDFTPIRRTVVDYVNVIRTKYPFWNRTLGADHFMLSCHDWVNIS